MAFITSHLAWAVTVSILPTFLFGYNTGCLNAVESVVFPEHTTAQWATAVSSFCLGGIVGAHTAGKIADKCGRRMALLMNGLEYVVVGLMHVFVVDMAMLTGARFLIGVAGGKSTVLTPMYLGEVSPPAIRGSIGTMTQVSVVMGILASILIALPYSSEHFWRIVFLPIPVVGLLQVVAGWYALPESPRWLLLNHPDERGQEAVRTIECLCGTSGSGVEDDVTEIEMIADRIKDVGTIPGSHDESMTGFEDDASSIEGEIQMDQEENPRSILSFLTDPRNRIPVISSLLFPIAQQLSGINAVFYYSTMFFEGVIDDPKSGTVAAFAVNVVATLLALPLMDRYGRRTLLSLSAGGMFTCCVILTFALEGFLPNNITFAAVLLYICSFGLGLGCIPFFLISELIEPEFFGRMQSLAMTTNWLCNFLVGMGFPFMVEHLGSFSFIPFAVNLFFTLVYAIVWLPETRSKSLHEVMGDIERRGRKGHTAVSLSPNEDASIL
uniref:Hexose transporter 1 n=1 Tax=Odontella aurita TaxID=265563 RepID=A0A6U6GVL9_9STRA|mmetsp:Transcript_44207/g.134614  ORF Transcript_44207/g.134614 Transcript_44207/m.134614 type:complete len:496 (+) Transcript_44207:766-2253(+)